MATIQMSAVADGISGVVGGVEFRNTRAGVVCASRRSRSSSVCQQPVRGLTKANIESYSSGYPLQVFWRKWWAETSEFRKSWDVWAASAGVPDRFGVRRPGEGWRLCYSAFWSLQEILGLEDGQWDFQRLTVPPPPGASCLGPVFGSVTAASSPASVVVAVYNPGGANSKAVLYMARMAMNRGAESVKGWRYCGTGACDLGGAEFVDWVSDIGWELQSGERIWCEVFAVMFGVTTAVRTWCVRSNPKYFGVTVS